MSELSEWDEQNVILTGSLDGIVRFWGIEFYDEEKTRRSPRARKSTTEKDESVNTTGTTRDTLNSSPFAVNSTIGSEDLTAKHPSTSSEVSVEEKAEGLSDTGTRKSVEETEEDNKEDTSAAEEPGRNSVDEQNPEEGVSVNAQRSGSGSEGVQRSGTLDEEYVIIESKVGSNSRDSKRKPVWKRRLVLRNKLTMHTAFDRMDNKAPAAITALKISTDHKKLYVGDARGRIYSWSVTDAAGRMANHWIKDESAESCCACNVKFATFERRHHCRDCGKVFCNKCSRFETPINRLQIYRPVRVCQDCFIRLTKDRVSSTTKTV